MTAAQVWEPSTADMVWWCVRMGVCFAIAVGVTAWTIGGVRQWRDGR